MLRSLVFVPVIALLAAGWVAASPGAADSPAAAEEPTETWILDQGADTGTFSFTDDRHSTYGINLGSLQAQFASAASRRSASGMSTRSADAPMTIQVPAPDGTLVTFAVTPVQIMADELAAAHPEIVAFGGTAVDDPDLRIRGDVSPAGFHATIRAANNPNRSWNVDPTEPRNATGTYVSYAARSVDAPRTIQIDKDSQDQPAPTQDSAATGSSALQRGGETVQERIVRVAIASDPSFAAFYGTDNVLAAKVTILNRVADVYNADLATHLVLADGTDKLNFDTPEKAWEANGPCGDNPCYNQGSLNNCNVDLLYQNRTAVRVIVGDENYDVGHIFLANAGGGMAGYGEIGKFDKKGGGCTGTYSPVGDAFAIDYVAHEIGHQFGASHSWNNCWWGSNSGYYGVEPGSASSIMGYAGLCGDNDLQTHSDPYLAAVNIDEIHRTLDERIASTPSENHNPVVTAPAAKTIPMRTPFTLTASGSDPDGDPVTYLWSQLNNGDWSRGLLDPGKQAGPLFRVFGTAADTSNTWWQYHSPGENLADGNTSRTFPDIRQVLAGNTNAATGDCPTTSDTAVRRDCYSEFLPTSAYNDDLMFRVQARDGRLDGGGISSSDVTLTLDRSAGPLLVDAPSASGTVAGGTTQTLTWQVNGTDKPELAPNVRITADTDGSDTFSTVLVASTPNDGSATFMLPNIDSTDVRVRVEAIDNYFFAVAPTSFSVQSVIPGEGPRVNYCTQPGTVVSATFSQTEYGGYPATNACDGDTGTSWSTWTSGTYQDSVAFTATMADPHPIDRVMFTTTEGLISGEKVEYLDADGTWHDTSAASTPSSVGVQTLLTFPLVTTDAIRITFDTPASYLKIPEIAILQGYTPPTSVAVTGPTSLEAGQTATLAATVEPATASQVVVWESSDPTVATVDDTGTVTALEAGTTTITGRALNDPTVETAITITVTAAPTPAPPAPPTGGGAGSDDPIAAALAATGLGPVTPLLLGAAVLATVVGGILLALHHRRRRTETDS